MKGESYGSISKNTATQKYSVHFHDTLNKKGLYCGRYETRSEAEEKRTEFVFEYYKDKMYLLPKGISVYKSQKSFSFFFRVNGKKIHAFIHKDLKEVIKYRIDFIASLL